MGLRAAASLAGPPDRLPPLASGAAPKQVRGQTLTTRHVPWPACGFPPAYTHTVWFPGVLPAGVVVSAQAEGQDPGQAPRKAILAS